MKKSRHLAVCCACVFTFATTFSNAELVSRLGGQAVYDTDLDITWLADANLATSNNFAVTGITANGTMDWNTAISWIAAMNIYDSGNGYLGFSGWRLPSTLNPDSSCHGGAKNAPSSIDNSIGFCSGSEMGHLFFSELSGTAGEFILTGTDLDIILFSNIQPYMYWSGTEYDLSSAWAFPFSSGHQHVNNKIIGEYAWAVADGDVFVPNPSAAWLFGSGLLSLIGISRRKKQA